jgi:hypothetical protein
MSVIERTPYEACPLCGDEAIVDVGTFDCTRHPLYHPPLPATISWCECYRCHHVFTDGYFEGSAAAEVPRPGGEWLDGIPARRAALESLREQARYAMISLADVLEHMPFPRPALEQAWRRSNPYWVEIEHYHNFSRPRLEDVLRQTGFEALWHHPNDRYLCGLDVAARRIAA